MNQSAFCGACGGRNPAAAKFCSGCGKALPPGGASASFRERTYVEQGGFQERTVLESSHFSEKTVLESGGYREATVMESPALMEKTRLEKAGFGETTVLEVGSAAMSAPHLRKESATPPAGAPSFVEPTVFVGAGRAGETPGLAGWLVVVTGVGEGKDYRLCHGKNAIGRHPRSDVLISDPSISADHAVIWLEKDTCTIADLNSRNGVLVNGGRIFQPAELAEGDWLTLGEITLQLALFRARKGF